MKKMLQKLIVKKDIPEEIRIKGDSWITEGQFK